MDVMDMRVSYLLSCLLLWHIRMGNSANVPELAEDNTTLAMNGVGHSLPPLNLLLRPDPRGMRPLSALLADERPLV
jgi:hypothetical protein